MAAVDLTDVAGGGPEPDTARRTARLARWQRVALPTWVLLALLAVATVVLRVPFLTPRLAHWDAVNYALGLHDFNVAAHQPHPPGSPYFILLGRGALALVGDDNAALQVVSVTASVGAVLGEYALARQLFGRPAGLVAAVVLLTQPVFWGYGTMAMPWTLLACLSVLIGLVCALLIKGRRHLVLPSAVLLGVASGFRLDVTVFLGPLWLWAVWRAEPRWRKRSVAVIIVVGCVLVWLVPVAASSGGLSDWYARLVALLPPTDVAPDTKARQLAANTAISFGTLVFSVGPLVLLSLASDWRAAFDWTRGVAHSAMKPFWMLWIGPAFVFLWLVDSTEPGHALLFSVALGALGAGLLEATARTSRRLVGLGALLAAGQALVFVLAAPQVNRPLAWTANAMLLNVTAPGLRLQQASLDDALRTIQGRFDPTDTVILTAVGQDPYRFMMYYLPTYRVLRLDPDTNSVLPAFGRRQAAWAQPAGCLFGDAASSRGVRHAVWVLAANGEPGLIPVGATRVSSADNSGPFQVWDLLPDAGTPAYLGFTLGGDCASG